MTYLLLGKVTEKEKNDLCFIQITAKKTMK